VTYALVQDIAASWGQYQRLAETMSAPTPAGLILHVAGPTDEGVRTIDLWESEQAWETFRSSRLEQAITALSGSFRPRSTSRDLRPGNIVIGADLGVVASTPSQQTREEQ
jgi:hypothetical protein